MTAEFFAVRPETTGEEARKRLAAAGRKLRIGISTLVIDFA
jgi:hypothetical protein